jgi:hypothetical protein
LLLPGAAPSRGQRGQALIFLVFTMTVVFVIGVIAIDIGLWVSERRGAQKDGDASVLAGAQAYLNDLSGTSTAFDDAFEWAVRNGVDPGRIDPVPTSDCSDGNSCINVGIGNCREDGTDTAMPWVEAKIRHQAPQLFTSIMNVLAPDIGAIARACVGSPLGMSGLNPFGVQTGMIPPEGDPEAGDQCLNDTDDDGDGVVNDGCPLSGCMEPDPDEPTQTRPVYGSVCILKTGAQGGVSGQRGQLNFGIEECSSDNVSNLEHDFHYGSLATCYVGQEVTTGTGNILGLLKGLNARLHDEGKCDALFGAANPGYDDFPEVYDLAGSAEGPVVPSAEHVFALRDCYVTTGVDVDPDEEGHVHTYVPRHVDLVLIKELIQGSQTAIITGFAGFYVIGCYHQNDSLAMKELIEQDLTDFGQYLNRCDKPTGREDILGIFVRRQAPPAAVGDPQPGLPIAIVLVK